MPLGLDHLALLAAHFGRALIERVISWRFSFLQSEPAQLLLKLVDHVVITIKVDILTHLWVFVYFFKEFVVIILLALFLLASILGSLLL